MFSGIVEEMGTVEAMVVNKEMPMWDGSVGEGVELTVNANVAMGDSYIGCSISVNGVCLTATSLDESKFTVGLAPETLRRTNLGKLGKGSKVNLERALRADGRNSGHFVQGHVDCTGKILKKWNEGDSLWVRVQVDQDFIKYIVPKGFICIDGTSLTVCEVDYSEDNSWFTFMLIAHTQQAVIIPSKEEGDLLNIEVDVLAKMVESSVAGFSNAKAGLNNDEDGVDSKIKELETKVDRLEKVIEAMGKNNNQL